MEGRVGDLGRSKRVVVLLGLEGLHLKYNVPQTPSDKLALVVLKLIPRAYVLLG